MGVVVSCAWRASACDGWCTGSCLLPTLVRGFRPTLPVEDGLSTKVWIKAMSYFSIRQPFLSSRIVFKHKSDDEADWSLPEVSISTPQRRGVPIATLCYDCVVRLHIVHSALVYFRDQR